MKTLMTMLVVWLGVTSPMSAPVGSVEDVIDSEMGASGAPGLAYAVVTDGDITAAGARGVVEFGGDDQVTPDTPFLIGSISKSFTALAVMLVEAGKIQLDGEASQQLDIFTSRNAGDLTVRQLLSHTSGYSTLQGNAASHTDVIGVQDELARRVDQLAEVSPAHAPDEKWEYSNTNFQILGRMVEVVSGQDYRA